jgi:hypothetical protein
MQVPSGDPSKVEADAAFGDAPRPQKSREPIFVLFAGLCVVMGFFFPRFLLAVPVFASIALSIASFVREPKFRVVSVLIGVLAIGLLALGEVRASSFAAPAEVTYSVTGSAARAEITMENGQGGTEQTTVSLPWSQPVDGARSGQFVYISAQNQSGYGDVTCTIRVNGADFKSSTSSSEYGIADCSGEVP